MSDVPVTPPSSSDGLFDPGVYLRFLHRRGMLILGVAVLLVLVATLYSVRQTKLYQSATSVIIDAMAPNFLDNQVREVVETGAGGYWYNKDYYETQFKIITSRSVSERVVEKLGLQSDPNFLGMTGIKNEEERVERMKTADAAGILQSKVAVAPVKESRVVNIVVTDVDPARAALLANEVAEAYIAENVSLKLKMTETASLWLEDRLKSLEGASKKTDLQMYEFKKASDILETSLEDRQSMISQRLQSYNTSLTQVRTQIAAIRAKINSYEELRKAATSESFDWTLGLPTAENVLITQLKVKYAEQNRACAELKDRYLGEHPKLVACHEMLKTARDDLNRELLSLVKATVTELNEAQANEKNLAVLFEGAKADAFQLNKKQLEFERIKREADNNNRLFDLVSKRLKDIELSGLLRTSNARILDPARPHVTPIRPRVLFNILVAAIVGLLLGIGAAFAVDMLDTRILTQEQVEEWLQVSFLGILPSVTRGEQTGDIFVHRAPKSALAECCRAIRTNLLFMSPDKPLKTILVTSSRPDDGKTTTSINLATTMAESGNRVLLVDGDMRRPRIHRAFNLPNAVGLSSLILGQDSVDEAIKTTEVPNLFVMACGPVPPNPGELLHAQGFEALIDELSQKFDKIIIDSPPIGAVADALVISTKVDGAVVVLKAGRTSRDIAQRTVRALRDVNARIFGTVLNDLDIDNRGYHGYYDYSRYSYHSHDPA